MTYRILQGQLYKQTVAGGRWESVDRDEADRVLALASEIASGRMAAEPVPKRVEETV